MNNKKFPGRLFSKQKIVEFLDKKGFYIVLFLCILVVGATAVFITTYDFSPSDGNSYSTDKTIPEEEKNESSPDLSSPVHESQKTTVTTETNKIKVEEEISAVSSDEKTYKDSENKDMKVLEAKQEESNPKNDSETNDNEGVNKDTETGKKNRKKFIMPVYGHIVLEYAMDKLVYSKTLEDWRTHSGIDIASSRGTSVKAAADGIVTDIKKDPRFGITVIIDHKNGFKTVYSNLAGDDVVYPNQRVKQEDIVGAVGDTAVFESVEESHLHFEILKNNDPVNPADYLPDFSEK